MSPANAGPLRITDGLQAIDLSPKFFTTNITCAILLSPGGTGGSRTSFFCLRHVLQNGLGLTLVPRESWERLDSISVLGLFTFEAEYFTTRLLEVHTLLFAV